MSKRNRAANQNYYNRPSKAYQQNMMKNYMADNAPEMPSRKKLLAMNIVALIIVLALIILANHFFAWYVGLLPLLLGFGYLIWFMRYVNGKQTESVKFQMEMGVDKKTFMKQLKRQKMKDKDQNFYSRTWDLIAGEVKPTWLEKIMGYGRVTVDQNAILNGKKKKK